MPAWSPRWVADVDGLAVGDRVLTLPGVGAFTQDIVVDARTAQVHRIPDEMPFDEAAAFNLTYGTAGIGLQRGAVKPGETLLVLGAAGGCGSAAIQVGKAMGMTVIAVAGGADKVALCTRARRRPRHRPSPDCAVVGRR